MCGREIHKEVDKHIKKKICKCLESAKVSSDWSSV